LYWGSLAEMPAFFVTWILADHPALGRRKSLILSFIGASACMAVLLIFGYDALIPASAIAKFFIGMAFILSYQYSLEIYETHNRVTGLGTCSAVGRVGGIMMPIVSILGTKSHIMLPYVGFMICGIASTLALFTMNYETAGKQLDSDNHEFQENQEK
jgi:hypothetical protein